MLSNEEIEERKKKNIYKRKWKDFFNSKYGSIILIILILTTTLNIIFN